MRIAIVAGALPPSPAPAATTVKQLVDELVLSGHQPLVLAPGIGPPSYRGVRIVRLRESDTGRLTRELAAFGPDLVHLADPRLLGSTALRAAAHLGLPTVRSHHQPLPGPLPGPLGTHWRGGPAADLVLAPCTAAREQLTKQGVQARVWRAGVDTELYRPEMRSPVLVEKWTRQDRLVVGHIGPVDRPHVFQRLVRIGRLPGVRLVAVRVGAGADRLRAKVPGAKVLGEVSGVDLAHAVASYDVLVQPRRREIECHGVRRALASGIPVVALATGGVTDLVAHEVNGLLQDPEDRDGLVDGVRRLRDDPGLRGRLAERARDSLAGRTWTVAVTELVDLHWSGLVGSHSGDAARLRAASA